MPKTQPFRFIAYFAVLPICCGSFLAAIYNFVLIPYSANSDFDYYNVLFIVFWILAGAAALCVILALFGISWRIRAKIKYVFEFFFFVFLSAACFFALVTLLINPSTLFLGKKFPSKRKHLSEQTQPMVINNISILDIDNRTVLKNARVLIDEGKIQEIESAQDIIVPSETKVFDGEGKMLLPGLIDTHVYLGLSGKMEGLYRSFFVESLEQSMERNARLTIESGVTTVREMPGYFDSSFVLKEAIEQGRVTGPKMVVSGRAITQRGGYFGWPFGHLTKDTNGVRVAIDYNLKQGAGFIVTPTPNSTLSRSGERDMSEDLMEAAIKYAESKEVDITAHVMWPDGVDKAAEKGIKGLEHMPSVMRPLKKNSVDKILREGIYVVPTIAMYTNLNRIVSDPEIIESDEYRKRFGPSVKIAQAYAQEYNGFITSENVGAQEEIKVLDKAISKYFKPNFSKLVKAGVTMGVGTGAGDQLMPHGWISKELQKYVEYGMSPIDALVAATYTNAFILKKENEIGRIRTGFKADLLIVEGDPTVNIKDIENVEMVFKDGVLVYEK